MPTWLVTGGAGFIGGNFVLEAVAAGVRIVNDGATSSSSYSSMTSTLPRNKSTIARCHEITRWGAIQGVSNRVRVDMAFTSFFLFAWVSPCCAPRERVSKSVIGGS